MLKSAPIVLLFLAFINNLAGQNLKENLQSKAWYCNCNFNSDLLVLSADNKNRAECEARFSSSGRLILRHIIKRRIDSTYIYFINNNNVVLNFDVRDSVRSLEYKAKQMRGRKAYQLSIELRSNYIKRKGDDTIAIDHFSLLQEEKRKTILNQEEITVFSQKRALHNDSIDLAVWGQFVGYISDTLLMDSDQFVEHNFYKKYTDTLHYIAPLLFDTIIRIKVPTKEITGIYIQREPFTSINTGATLLALGTGFVCISASLITGNSSMGSAFAKAGVISFLTIPVWFSLGMIFSTKKFQMTPGKKIKKNWKVERHMPGIIVTEGKSEKAKLRIKR